jgi:NAD(P)-dependent dehydrogenase (short-subunit alcohol dehydrogenase family)
MVVLCANSRTPPGGKATMTEDNLESTWGLNYIANFHLLSILSPALRAQPPDRDVRILIGTCSSYMGGQLPESVSPAIPTQKGKTSIPQDVMPFTPGSVYATSKLALMTFALAFQKHLSAYDRPDKKPMNTRVYLVDPGWTRTPGMRRFLSMGSVWGLFLYLFMWPLWWLFLKSADQGAQTFLYAAMEAQYGRGEGGLLLKECKKYGIMRGEVVDEDVQKRLWAVSEQTIEKLEKESAKRRAAEKKTVGKTTAKQENGAAKQRKGK